MSVNNAYQLALGVFKQSSSGSVWNKLPAPFDKYKWDKSASIIPTTYDFTNYQIGDATVETVEKNTITMLSKARMYDSGAMTPPTLTFATMLPADAAMLIDALDALTAADADDQYKVLIVAGAFASETSGTRTYNVFNSVVGVLTTDGGRQGEAKAPFTGTLAFQACHLPLIGATANGSATLTWDLSDGSIALSGASST